jgi:hypothetical protein
MPPHTIESVRLILIIAALTGMMPCAQAQVQIFPLSEVRPGMTAMGRTVFEGDRIEEFSAEILGVLENIGPRQSIILARLSGGPLERTGVLQGMSGSPVYLDGKLLGAVALSFPFSKEPIAGIRPIEEMLLAASTPPTAPRAERPGNPFDLASLLPAPTQYDLGSTVLTEISTPFWMTGFTRNAFQHFAPMLRAAGLEPVQGLPRGKVLGRRIRTPSPRRRVR